MPRLYNLIYAEHLLSFWESGILVHARQRASPWSTPVETLSAESLMRASPWSAPVETLSAESLMGFLVKNHCTHVAAFSLLVMDVFCDLSWVGEGIRKHLGSSRLCLYLFSLSLSCVSLLHHCGTPNMSPMESLNLGLVLRTLDTKWW